MNFSQLVARFWNNLRRLVLVRATDRGAERFRRAGLSGATSVISQGLAVAISIVSVPLTLSYLGPERYGVWLTISSLLTWFSLTEFGFAGNALVNAIAEAEGLENHQLAQEGVSTAFWCLTTVSLILAAFSALAILYFPTRNIFRVSSAISDRELTLALSMAVSSFVLMFPLSTVTAVYQGKQEGYMANVWMIAGHLASLTALIIVCRYHGGLPALVAALSFSRMGVFFVNAIYLFGFRHPTLRPAPSRIRLQAFRRLWRLGGKYMITQLAALAMSQSQPVMITQLLGPSYVFIFTVAQRFLTLPFNMIYILTLPLLSAYGEARTRGDWPWVWKAFRRSVIFASSIGFLSIALFALVARPVIRLWAGPLAVPELSLIVWISIYALGASVLAPITHLLMGVERMNGVATAVVLTAVATVGTTLALGRAGGLAGISMAMALSLILVNGVGQIREVILLKREVRAAAVHIPIKPEISSANA